MFSKIMIGSTEYTIAVSTLDSIIIEKMRGLPIEIYGGWVRDTMYHAMTRKSGFPEIKDMDLKFRKTSAPTCREEFYIRLVSDPNLRVTFLSSFHGEYNDSYPSGKLEEIINDQYSSIILEVSFCGGTCVEFRKLDMSFENINYYCSRNLDMDVNGLSIGPFSKTVTNNEFLPYVTNEHNECFINDNSYIKKCSCVKNHNKLELNSILRNIKLKKFMVIGENGECSDRQHDFPIINSVIGVMTVHKFTTSYDRKRCVLRHSRKGIKYLERINKMIDRGWKIKNKICWHPGCILSTDSIYNEYREFLDLYYSFDNKEQLYVQIVDENIILLGKDEYKALVKKYDYYPGKDNSINSLPIMRSKEENTTKFTNKRKMFKKKYEANKKRKKNMRYF